MNDLIALTCDARLTIKKSEVFRVPDVSESREKERQENQFHVSFFFSRSREEPEALAE